MVWDIYLEATAGEAMAFAGGRLQGPGSTAVCRNMERLKLESAGELEVLREMRGCAEPEEGERQGKLLIT